MMNTGAVLVVAAHPDDEVLGCGGFLARAAAVGRQTHVLILADGESARSQATQAARNGRSEAARHAARALGVSSLEMLNMPDNRLDSLDLLDIVQRVETMVRRVQPATVLTHHHGDVNVDHRITHEAVLAACRPLPGSAVTELLFFEVPSSTEWRPAGAGTAFMPTVFVDISSVMETKQQALLAYSEELRASPHPRSLECVDALATWRGAMAGCARAEAFVLGRAIW